jgi:preprotein translocase subunit SecF
VKTIDIIGQRKLYYLISLIIILPGLISLIIPPHLKLAVDFTGGTLWELQFQQNVQPAQVKEVLAARGYGDAIVQTSGERDILIRAKEIPADQPIKGEIASDLKSKFGDFTELRFETVGPVVGQEVATRALFAVALASIGILLYIAWAFRKVDNPFRYGVCAILALLHDALVVLGIFSILGHLFDVEVDALFVTAVLTVIGFSVHDTIVVFDRIRENQRRMHGMPFDRIVNHSLIQTLGRSLATSLTVIFTLSALVLFGGITTREFALALLIGIISGTYSSIFNASAMLVSWENGEIARLFGRGRPSSAARSATA